MKIDKRQVPITIYKDYIKLNKMGCYTLDKMALDVIIIK
jgi:hypothetical protein